MIMIQCWQATIDCITDRVIKKVTIILLYSSSHLPHSIVYEVEPVKEEKIGLKLECKSNYIKYDYRLNSSPKITIINEQHVIVVLYTCMF